MAALERRLPSRHWLDINRLLVPFGKHICRGVAPKCPTCPVLDQCQRLYDLAGQPELPGQAPRPRGRAERPDRPLLRSGRREPPPP
jgi:adenine-specific DNA glycosylase